MTKYLVLALLLTACSLKENNAEDVKIEVKVDSAAVDSMSVNDTLAKIGSEKTIPVNDTLTTLAKYIAGKCDSCEIYKQVAANKYYIDFAQSFSKRWEDFDSSRILKLTDFRNKELGRDIAHEKTLFYPFSGPDILYANLFFPETERFILVGLEPVGTLPDLNSTANDSLKKYYNKINSSLHAILKFSFFRTESMSRDLKNEEVDGTIHLLFLFLSRTGNSIVSAKPVTIDSSGNKIYMASFEELKSAKLMTKGVEIVFKTPEEQVKELDYYSLNLINTSLNKNAGFTTYLDSLKTFNTYLKGASYLLHKPYFSVIRNKILQGSSTIVQDDSGIALRYFKGKGTEWDYKLFGNYTRPISLFRNCYQKDLDSLYKQNAATPLGFGIGYNFKDKNSNLMLAKRK
jgi:hypothetical protein